MYNNSWNKLLEDLFARLNGSQSPEGFIIDLVNGQFCKETSEAVSKKLGIPWKDGWFRTDDGVYNPHMFCVDYEDRRIMDINAIQFNRYLKRKMPQIVNAYVLDPLVDGRYFHLNKQRVRLHR